MDIIDVNNNNESIEHANVCDNSSKEELKDILELNSYGRRKILGGEKKEMADWISNAFCDFFVSQGCTHEQPVSINSGIDDSVYFIGAPTSVLKPYLINGAIPQYGICMQQPSFRTHNAKRLKDNNPLRWGSTFTGISCMSNYCDGAFLMKISIDFLLHVLKIPLDNIAININSKDRDLIEFLNIAGNTIPLVFDTKDPKYYTHRYGLGEVVGRNFNFVLKDQNTGVYNDIGNFIIIEDSVKKYGIESGFGSSVIMQHLYGLEHVLDVSIISNVILGNSIAHRKLQDSIVTSFLMCDLGVVPRRNETKGRIFKRYLAGIKHNQELLHISGDELGKILKDYENAEYGECKHSDFIISELNKK